MSKSLRALLRLALSWPLLLSSPVALAQAQSDIADVLGYAPRARVPEGYAPAYEAIVRTAEDEGRLVVYSTTDLRVAQPLIDDFRSMFPRVQVSYEDLNSTVLYHRSLAESHLGRDSADVLWSSAMDQQALLVSKGYAMTYASPEKAALPDWAHWKDQAYATTFEPVVFAYNRNQLKPDEVPRTHADFARLIRSGGDRFKGKLVGYDIEKSGLGFFLAMQDIGVSSSGYWDIAEAMGGAGVRLELATDAMVRRLVSGRAVLGYNLLGAYTISQAQRQPSLGYVFPKDYTLVMSRIVLINAQAAHPNAARLWVDYLLSRRGQAVIANASHLYALRSDVQGETTAAKLRATLGASARPIVVGPALTEHLDDRSYRDAVLQWRRVLSRR